jgi:hypothetical protein
MTFPTVVHKGVVNLTEPNVGDDVVGFTLVGLDDDEGLLVVGLAEVGFADVGKLLFIGFAGLLNVGTLVVGSDGLVDDGVLVLGVDVVGELLLIGLAVVGEGMSVVVALGLLDVF